MTRIPCVLASALLLGACTGTGNEYRPIVDGEYPNYETDLKACQELAEQRSYANADAATSVGVGARLFSLCRFPRPGFIPFLCPMKRRG